MPPRGRALVLTQAGLGVRVQELLALRVADVDFLRRAVLIEDQLDPATRTREPLKTPESRRTLPLPQVVADALAAHYGLPLDLWATHGSRSYLLLLLLPPTSVLGPVDAED